MNNATTSKPITKYVTLKITYDPHYAESPEAWDWNTLVDIGPDENVEVVRSGDFPPSDEF